MSQPASTAPPAAAAQRSKQKQQKQPKDRAPPSSASSSAAAPAYDYSRLSLVDIGCNLLDDQYSGVYHGKRLHAADIEAVVARAAQHGVHRIIVTAGTLEESRAACDFIHRQQQQHTSSSSSSPPLPELYTTCGIHPTRSRQFASLSASELSALQAEMAEFIRSHPAVVAIGECGMDGDRQHFSSLEEQRAVFPLHLSLAASTGLPLFLHDRSTDSALHAIIASSPLLPSLSAVVHSFTGTEEELQRWTSLGFSISVNGCSMKDAQQLQVVRAIPLDRLLLETDAPWCDVKPTHAAFPLVRTAFTAVRPEKLEGQTAAAAAEAASSQAVLVKGRNEPCKLICVAEAVAAVKGVTVDELLAAVRGNTDRLFFRSRGSAT